MLEKHQLFVLSNENTLPMQVLIEERNYATNAEYQKDLKKIQKKSFLIMSGFPGKSTTGILSLFCEKVRHLHRQHKVSYMS